VIKIEYNGEMRVADVEFYLYMHFGDLCHPLAVVTLFSLPDAEVLADSSHTVYLCRPLQTRTVIPITTIWVVVSMFPEVKVDQMGEITTTENFSLMWHIHLGLPKYPQGQDISGNEGSM
jgi:hypothetical protein